MKAKITRIALGVTVYLIGYLIFSNWNNFKKGLSGDPERIQSRR